MASLVDYSTEGAVALVRLNRPPVNALSDELSADLKEAFQEAAGPEIRALVVTGQPHFAAGADIKAFRAVYEGEGEQGLARTLAATVGVLERLEKPTIAAIHGYALGGGLELSLGADFRFLAEDALVGQPEIKLGLIPGAGGTQRLARVVGFQAAKDIVFSGRQVSAEEALRIGLADRIFPPDRLLEESLRAAEEMATWPTRAIASAKRALAGGWGRPLAEGLDMEAAEFDVSFWTEDAREGVAAFLEKRATVFRGR
jgi:enoyl-CoA hydratase/carnithine racemase